jgi:hypothetical protein
LNHVQKLQHGTASSPSDVPRAADSRLHARESPVYNQRACATLSVVVRPSKHPLGVNDQ